MVLNFTIVTLKSCVAQILISICIIIIFVFYRCTLTFLLCKIFTEKIIFYVYLCILYHSNVIHRPHYPWKTFIYCYIDQKFIIHVLGTVISILPKFDFYCYRHYSSAQYYWIYVKTMSFGVYYWYMLCFLTGPLIS